MRLLGETVRTTTIAAFFATTAFILFFASGSANAKASKLKKLSHLSFAKQVVNTSSPLKTVSISNTGSTPIAVQKVAASGDFIEVDNCVGVLQPKGNCTISVAFRPAATGKRRGGLAIIDDAKGSPQKIKLSGVGESSVPTMATYASLPGSDVSNLVAVTPLGQNPVPTSGTSAMFQTAPNVGQAAGVVDTVRGFGWTAVLPGWLQQPNPEIGPLSTAVYYVFMVPGVYTDNPSQQSISLAALANLAKVQTFAAALQNNAAGGDPLLVPAVQTAYRDAVSAGLTAAAALAPPAALPPTMTLGFVGGSKSGPSLAVTSSASHDGPIGLDENYAEFVFNNAGSTAVTVSPQWLPSSGITTGIGQGLYWIAAVYGVNTPEYPGFSGFQDEFANPHSPWNTNIGLNGQLMFGHLSPQTNFFSLLDVFQLADALFNDFTGSSSAGGTQFSLDLNDVYMLHLYTCGFGLGNTSNLSHDAEMIVQWDTPQAFNLWVASCGVNLSLIAADIIGLVTSIPDLLGNPSCKGPETNAVTDISDKTITDLAPLLSVLPAPSLSDVELAVGDDAISAVEDLIPVAACDVTTEGLQVLLDNLNVAFKILSVISNAGNLGNTIGSSLGVEPWQGAYIEVGNPPWSAPTATPTATPTNTSSRTPSTTPTQTSTSTSTVTTTTPTPTSSPTATASFTATSTSSSTPTPTLSSTATSSATATPAATCTPSGSLNTCAATEITSSGAVFNGNVNPGGSNGQIYFEYSKDPGLVTGVAQTGRSSVVANDVSQPFAVAGTFLSSSSTYFYRMDFFNSGTDETIKGNIVSFDTLATPTTTASATEITSSGAVFNGNVNPGGSGGRIFFEYSKDPGLVTGVLQTGSTSVVANNLSQPFAVAASFLSSSSTYYYRMDFFNSGNDETIKGNIVSFDTLATPTTTASATEITSSGAVFNGNVNPGGSTGQIFFEYSKDPGLVTGVLPTGRSSVVVNNLSQPFAVAASFLSSSSTYYYRMDFFNSGNDETIKGNIVSFDTLATPTTTGAATSVTSTGATLNGSVNPDGSTGQVYFEYSTDPGLVTGVAQTGRSSVVANEVSQPFAVAVSFLSSSSTYFYRMDFFNSGNDETIRGNIVSFGTLAGSATSNSASSRVPLQR